MKLSERIGYKQSKLNQHIFFRKRILRIKFTIEQEYDTRTDGEL